MITHDGPPSLYTGFYGDGLLPQGLRKAFYQRSKIWQGVPQDVERRIAEGAACAGKRRERGGARQVVAEADLEDEIEQLGDEETGTDGGQTMVIGTGGAVDVHDGGES